MFTPETKLLFLNDTTGPLYMDWDNSTELTGVVGSMLSPSGGITGVTMDAQGMVTWNHYDPLFRAGKWLSK
ncbi:hypothetical protein AJ78_04485 [Emergomyces pasteurianus Ep9510]|uniref:Uncharacterized protein n=1 Tax=Emergomyces pasteurianus Ep9510 TaxID=1447872 RepID=A0A1J9QGG8_9EURO|nr:hypothetical protein AJ78_04485 [Emergomyces pasteurianus Ep9510]